MAPKSKVSDVILRHAPLAKMAFAPLQRIPGLPVGECQGQVAGGTGRRGAEDAEAVTTGAADGGQGWQRTLPAQASVFQRDSEGKHGTGPSVEQGQGIALAPTLTDRLVGQLTGGMLLIWLWMVRCSAWAQWCRLQGG